MSSSIAENQEFSDSDTVMTYYDEDLAEDSKYDQAMFEKPRGERRWLGKHHHSGKEHLHNQVKDRTYIKKTVTATEPLSKRATERLGESTKDGFELDVVYSLDKKKRWQTANVVSLLSSAPESVNAEVVEKNALEEFPEKSTFAVHSRKIDFKNAPGEFDIRSATSSGPGQHYSNFLPNSREMSKKANAKMYKVREDEEPKEEVKQATVSYNIYKTHKSSEVVGTQLFKNKVVSKSERHRANKKIDMDVYDDEEDYSDEEDVIAGDMELARRLNDQVDLCDFVVEKIEKQHHNQKNRKDSELSYEVVDPEALEPEPGFTNLMDIQSFLKAEGFTFEEADVTFQNQKENYIHQIGLLRDETGLKVKDLRPNQFLIDASEWCKLDGAAHDGETTTVIVLTHLKNNTYNVLVNSTIGNHPSKRGGDNLRKLISSALTFKEAIMRITSEIMTCRKTIETMKKSVAFYGRKTLAELLQTAGEWENQMLHMEWPNEHYHCAWANSKELSNVGGRLEWNDLCEMVKKEGRDSTCYTTQDRCGSCNQMKKSHELFLLISNEVKCTECLREKFYRELRARRIPIDLETDTADELEYLPTFIPLTVVNLYVRMVSEQIYKDLGAEGCFEKCPSCKSALYFEEKPGETSSKTQNRSCPCGYSWCKHCDRVPHWPMECGEYAEWEAKWILRYSMMHAQGAGTEQLLQITCSCAKAVYNVLLPVDFTQCPTCKTHVNMNTMNTVWKHYYIPYAPRFRQLVQSGYYNIGKDYDQSAYVPRGKVYTDIVKIPPIKTSVMQICGAARDTRLDVKFHKRSVNREHLLVQKHILDREDVENFFGTAAYLAEYATAWMHIRNQYDRNVKITLENLMETRRKMAELLEGEDKEAIMECSSKMRRDIDIVVTAIETKQAAAKSS